MNKGSWWRRLAWPAKWLWIWRLGMAAVLVQLSVLGWMAYNKGPGTLTVWWGWIPVAAGGLAATVAWYGCMACWMARSAGGLKGWRFGLLLIPGVGMVWNLVECPRIAVDLSRTEVRSRQWCAFLSAVMLCGFGFMICKGIAMMLVPGQRAAVLVLCAGILLGWGIFFECIADDLNEEMRFREVKPYSSARRRRELALVLGLGVVLPLALAAGWWGYWTWRIRVAVDQIAAAGLTETIPEELRPDIDPEAQAELKRLFARIRMRDLDYCYSERWNPYVDRRWRKRLAEFAGPVAEFDRWLDGETRFNLGWLTVKFFLGYDWMALRLADADGNREGVRANLERLEKLFVQVPDAREFSQWCCLIGVTAWAAAGGLARLEDADLERLAHSPWLRDIRLETRILKIDPAIVAWRAAPSRPWLVHGDAEIWELIAWGFERYQRDRGEWGEPLYVPYERPRSPKFEQLDALAEFDPAIEVRRRAALVLIALERYRRVHGGFPEQLEELTPEFLDAVPVAPRDGRPAELETGEFTRYVDVARSGPGPRSDRSVTYGFDMPVEKPYSKDLTREKFRVFLEWIPETRPEVRVRFGAALFTLPLEVDDE